MATYQIQKGNTLSGIAAANKTTVQALMAANPNIKDPNKIFAGANLNIPNIPITTNKTPFISPLKPTPIPTSNIVSGAGGSALLAPPQRVIPPNTPPVGQNAPLAITSPTKPQPTASTTSTQPITKTPILQQQQPISQPQIDPKLAQLQQSFPKATPEELQNLLTATGQSQQPPITYAVKSGDTLSSIARANNVSVDEISGYRSNDPNLIFPGEVLTIKKYTPPPIIEPTKTDTTIVKDEKTGQETPTTTTTPTEPPLTDTQKGYAGFLAEQIQASLYDKIKQELGLDDLKTRPAETSKALQAVNDEKSDKIADINSNPWLSDGQRLASLRRNEAKFAGRLQNLEDQLSREQKLYQDGVAEAQWKSKLIVDQYNEDREFYYQAKKDAAGLAKGTTDIQEYNLAVSQGYTGTLMDYQKEQANLKERIAKAGAPTTIVPTTQDIETKEVAEALGTVNQITNILPDKDFDKAFGAEGIINRTIPGSAAQRIAAEITNIKDKAAMAARGQLKGQGAVSNFEVQMLQNAQSALNFNLNPTDARQALINFRGAIQTSTGGEAKIQITDKKGKSIILMSTSRNISQAIIDGLLVKYIN